MNAEEEQSQAAAQFENACSDRIKQFDDSDSDEEVSVGSVVCGMWGVGCGGVGCGMWRVGCGVWGEECGLSESVTWSEGYGEVGG